jgi:taurine dioxygenase
VQPIAGAVGAELAGLDLSQDLDDGVIAAIRDAWLRHGVVFFRDQDLPPGRFLALRQYHRISVHQGPSSVPEIILVVQLEHEKMNFGGVWHTDTAYLDVPPMATMRIARQFPPMAAIPCLPTCMPPMTDFPMA